MKRIINLIGIFLLTMACQNDDKSTEGVAVEKEKVVFVENDSRLPSSHSVTAKFGTLVIQEGSISAQSTITPWTSYWYPSKEKTIFQSGQGLSALEKYDLVSDKNFSSQSTATQNEIDDYDVNEVAWAGLCHAWALASVIEKEPRQTRIIGNTHFSIGDQKALLLKTYDFPKGVEFYGDRFEGYENDDYNDVYPDQFHRFIQVYLIDQKKPFLMDYDASFPVWTIPVYKMKSNIRKLDESRAEVKTWITIASPFVQDPNFVGTKSTIKTYSYILIGEWKGPNLHVTDSEWTENSISDHPDYLIAYPEKIIRGSRNKEIRPDVVDFILGR